MQETFDTIHQVYLVASPEDLAKILEDIQKKGGIESKVRNDKKVYCNVPLVVGMYEYQLDRLTPEFVKNFNKYTALLPCIFVW